MFFFYFKLKNLQNLNPIQILQVLDSVQSYSDIWGASYNICRHIYSDDFWELPRDCDQPDSEEYDNADDHGGVLVEGLPYCTGVSA